MAGWFASGSVADFILLLAVIEAIAILVYRRRTGRGPSPVAILPTLAAGACLLLAFRNASVQGTWYWTAAFLWAALVAHGIDLASRWRR
jgi:hypothetical protein